jgi:hypothetical protein
LRREIGGRPGAVVGDTTSRKPFTNPRDGFSRASQPILSGGQALELAGSPIAATIHHVDMEEHLFPFPLRKVRTPDAFAHDMGKAAIAVLDAGWQAMVLENELWLFVILFEHLDFNMLRRVTPAGPPANLERGEKNDIVFIVEDSVSESLTDFNLGFRVDISGDQDARRLQLCFGFHITVELQIHVLHGIGDTTFSVGCDGREDLQGRGNRLTPIGLLLCRMVFFAHNRYSYGDGSDAAAGDGRACGRAVGILLLAVGWRMWGTPQRG